MNYIEILKNAKVEATKAFNACTPTPVSWVQTDLSNKPIGKPSPPDMEGDCGGAYIRSLHGKSAFVRWAKVNDLSQFGSIQKDVYTGFTIYLNIEGYRGQSAEKRASYANAFAKVLNENGIKCSVKEYLT